MIKLATALPLKSNLESDESIEMLKNKKILKHFTRPKQRATLRKPFSPSPGKRFLRL